MPGSWISLDLSLAEFHFNPAGGAVFGQYSGGKIQPITFGTGTTIAFGHPDLRFNTMDPTKQYEIEITYDAATQWTWTSVTAYQDSTNDTWWNTGGLQLRVVGNFDAVGVPGALSNTVGPTEPGSAGSNWVSAAAASYTGLTFNATNKTIITAMRYREIGVPAATRSGTASITLSGSLHVPFIPPDFDDPPGLPDGYSAWQELDFSTAIFFDTVNGPGGIPWGQYDTDKGYIVTNISWPDFYFPGFELDPNNDYYFQFVYDQSDPRHIDGWETATVWMLDPARPEDSYWTDPFSDIYNNEDFTSGDPYHLFHVDSGTENWDALSNGFTLPVFESGQQGVLAKIRWSVLENPILPPAVPRVQRTRARFWGQ